MLWPWPSGASRPQPASRGLRHSFRLGGALLKRSHRLVRSLFCPARSLRGGDPPARRETHVTSSGPPLLLPSDISSSSTCVASPSALRYALGWSRPYAAAGMKCFLSRVFIIRYFRSLPAYASPIQPLSIQIPRRADMMRIVLMALLAAFETQGIHREICWSPQAEGIAETG